MELKITEEFVRQAHGAACSTWKTKIEKEFPELFKRELEVGKWYKFKFKAGLELMSMITEIQADRIYWFGFRDNIWRDSDWSELSSINQMSLFTEATHEEVESALEKEIIKRFGEDWKNANIERCLYHGKVKRNIFTPVIDIEYNRIWNRNGCILNNGKWATILPEEKTIITQEKALKIIAKKLKVSPESIEIK